MNLSEMIAAHGDETAEFQTLDQCADSLNMRGAVTTITFGTHVRLDPIEQRTEKFGMVVWLDRARLKEILDKEKT